MVVLLVAIADVHGNLAQEAAPLAAILGVAAYDVKLWLSAALPRVVFQSELREEADVVLGAIRARGHGALACDASAIVTSDVVNVKRISIDTMRIGANDGAGDRLPYDSIGALIHVATRSDVERVTRESEPPYEGIHSGRPPQTGVRDRTSHEHILEHALFVFPVDGLTPWVILERGTKYLGLGPAMRPTAHENFHATIDLLRERAPNASYDDRFVGSSRTPNKVVRVRGSGAPEVPAEHGDPSVHLLALWLMRGNENPYRDAAPTGRAT